MAFFNPVDPDGKVNTVNPLLTPPPPPLSNTSTPSHKPPLSVKLSSPPPYYSLLINDRLYYSQTGKTVNTRTISGMCKQER